MKTIDNNDARSHERAGIIVVSWNVDYRVASLSWKVVARRTSPVW